MIILCRSRAAKAHLTISLFNGDWSGFVNLILKGLLIQKNLSMILSVQLRQMSTCGIQKSAHLRRLLRSPKAMLDIVQSSPMAKVGVLLAQRARTPLILPTTERKLKPEA